MDYPKRIAKLSRLLEAEGLEALAVLPGPNLYYLTGLSFHLMERPTVGIFPTHAEPRLILPELEGPKAEGTGFGLFTYGEQEGASLSAFQSGLAGLGSSGGRIGVEPLQMRFQELNLLQASASEAAFVSASRVLTELRIVKEASEIAAMQRAVEIAQQALAEAIPLIRLGMSERELASELSLQLLRAGSEPETPFSPIIASGPNSAFPHAVASHRRLGAGDLLILDWGARSDGYISDLTRTFALGEVSDELIKIHRAVQEANAAGRAAVRPDARCGEVDRAARAVIAATGYGDFFIHRTGHGIGLEAHEPPYIRDGEPTVLEPGMTFTVEPGIYLPGRGGVRVEDNLVVTKDGGDTLTSYPRELQVLG